MLYVISFIIVTLAVFGMALGVVFGRPAIKGSCGGVAGECSLCTERCRKRDNRHA